MIPGVQYIKVCGRWLFVSIRKLPEAHSLRKALSTLSGLPAGPITQASRLHYNNLIFIPGFSSRNGSRIVPRQ